MENGAGSGRLVRRHGAQCLVGVDPAQCRLPRRPRRPASALVVTYARSARPALVRTLPLVLQPGRNLQERAARGATARLPACAYGLDRLPRPRGQPGAVLAGLGACSRCRVPRRVADRPQSREPAWCDRCRLRRCDRRRQDPRRPGPVRPHAGRGLAPGLRQGRRRRCDPRSDPAERPLRIGQPARRHVRSDGIPRVRSRSAYIRLVWKVGRVAGGACDRDRVRSARRPRPDHGRAPIRRHAACCSARLRLGRVPLHRVRGELEHERRDHARDPRLGLLARDVACRPGNCRGARRLDEVCGPPARTALAHLSERAPAPDSGALCSGVHGRIACRTRCAPARAEPCRGGAHLPRSHARIPTRA